GQPAGKQFTRTYRVAAIADVPPVLVDDSDQVETGVLPAGATRQLLPEYGFAVVGLRLDSAPAGIAVLQDRLAALARSLEQRGRGGGGGGGVWGGGGGAGPARPRGWPYCGIASRRWPVAGSRGAAAALARRCR